MLLFLTGILLFGAYAILIWFYKKAWDGLGLYEPQTYPAQPPFLSLIVAARNEAETLPRLLRSLKTQTYPADRFELIVVDDHSTDGTAVLLQKEPSVKYLPLCEGVTSKKKAIAAGIAAANGDIIITTDADCVASPQWLQTLSSFYVEKGAAFIAAPVKYMYRNNLLEMFQTLDFLTLQGITAASVTAKFHSMCNGANLAYTKAAFHAVNGFSGIDAVASGDDMLLMHKIWKQHPHSVFYLKSKAAIVETAPMPTWKDFFWQRIRWASKTTAYDDKRIFWALLLVYLFNAFFVVLLGAGFWEPRYWLLAVVLWVAKTAVELPFVYAVARFFDQQKSVRYFFLFQPLHILYTVLIGAISQTGSYQWKGRKTK
jgi:cellulose synthase/poly-beta-1,6-N-acetylglucosamine synthase-like glycosyltransferase